jgi:hypothetical protein
MSEATCMTCNAVGASWCVTACPPEWQTAFLFLAAAAWFAAGHAWAKARRDADRGAP